MHLMINDLQHVPTNPGVYQFFNQNEIIYIGKAKNLKKRVRSYFTKAIKDLKTEQIKKQAIRVETFTTFTEAEALILEQQLIKEYKPKFNILLRDDKTYPFIFFNSKHEYPSILIKRSKKAVSEDYYGPYTNIKLVKEQVKELQKIFNLRNCSDSTFANRSRPCIEYQMRRCSAPCVKFISREDYQEDISSAKAYIAAEKKHLRQILIQKMRFHAERLEFEVAENFKQKIKAIEVLEKESQLIKKPIDLDIVSIAFKDQLTGMAFLGIRGGRVQSTKSYYFKEDFKENIDDLLQRFCFEHYQQKYQISSKIFISNHLKDKKVLEQGLSKKFNKPVKLITRKNKNNSHFIALAALNAKQAIINKLGNKEKFKESFMALDGIFNKTKQRSHTLECIDISHHSGRFAKASIVHFSSVGKEKKNYRTYNIPGKLAGNDTGSIEYVVQKRLGKNKIHPTYLLIDGGKHQLNAALQAKPNGSKTSILSIAKGANRRILTETIFTSIGQTELVNTSKTLKFLLLARDEAHRFALKANRSAKRKSMKLSVLDNIRGVGPIRKEILIKKFKSIRALKHASFQEIYSTQSISAKLAAEIVKTLK